MEHELPLVGQAAVAVAQHSGADGPRGARQGDDIHLGVSIHHAFLAGGHALNGLDLVAQQGIVVGLASNLAAANGHALADVSI